MLLRLLQEGEQLGMPQSEQLPNVGRRCGALRVRDAEHNWRIMYRADSDAILWCSMCTRRRHLRYRMKLSNVVRID